MRNCMKKFGLFVIVLTVISMLGATINAEAAVKWAFSTSNGRKKASVNATIMMEKGEYQDMNLYRNGKQIKEKDATYTVKWYSSDKNVVYVDKASGKMKADKYGKMTKDTGSAKITAVIKNKKTGTMAKKSFTVKVNSEKNSVGISAEQVKIGGYVTFGSYEQDNVLTNGKEPIEWLVLDVQDGKALLLSKYALDCKPYNETKEEVYWENSTLRHWLNNEFYSAAFNATEKTQIIEMVIGNSLDVGGNVVKDTVSLMSAEEARRYFPYFVCTDEGEMNLELVTQPTKYAKAQGIMDWWGPYAANCQYWLRSDSVRESWLDGSMWGKTVDLGGGIVEFYTSTLFAVRPTIWIKLSETVQQ